MTGGTDVELFPGEEVVYGVETFTANKKVALSLFTSPGPVDTVVVVAGGGGLGRFSSHQRFARLGIFDD